MKTLVIAEKPSVARDIAKVLHCNKKGNNYIEGEKHIITWALGHLVALKDPDKIDEKYKKWRLEDLPILPAKIPISVISKTSSQYKTIKELMFSEEVENIICATDAGREGELIFRLIYEQSRCTKPFFRLWISSLTDESIADGFNKLKDGSAYDSLYYSAICRAYADWYIGMNASRLFSIHYKSVLSIGRVQTPTLALIVQRQADIDNFIPQEYYTILGNFGDLQANWFNPENKNAKLNKQIATKELANHIVEECKGQECKVISNDTTRHSDIAPQLYDLTTLQREANEKFGYTADKTLKIAQELYEKYKLLTYPRTDSRYLSDDIRPKIPNLLQSLNDSFNEHVKTALQGYKNHTGKRVFNNEKVSDHHAIIPTGKKINWKQLPPDISNILKMVIVRFMQVFFPPYVSDIQKIILVYEKHHFLCQGKTIIDMGWKALDELLPSKKKTNNDNDIEIPAIQVNDSRTLKSAKIKEDKTKPPEQYTDASLLSAMENAGKLVDDEELKSALKDRGLGTPATRAAIIERLIKVGYVQRQKKYFVPTDKGKKLISVVPNEISSAELTGNWECKLSDIANKSEDSKNLSLAFLNGIRNFTNSLVNGYQINTAIQFEAETKYKKKTVKGLGTCPLCKKGQVLENSKGFYCSRWRENCKFTIWKNTLERNNGPTINAQIIELLLKDSQVKGSSGTILLNGDKVEFQSK